MKHLGRIVLLWFPIACSFFYPVRCIPFYAEDREGEADIPRIERGFADDDRFHPAHDTDFTRTEVANESFGELPTPELRPIDIFGIGCGCNEFTTVDMNRIRFKERINWEKVQSENGWFVVYERTKEVPDTLRFERILVRALVGGKVVSKLWLESIFKERNLILYADSITTRIDCSLNLVQEYPIPKHSLTRQIYICVYFANLTLRF